MYESERFKFGIVTLPSVVRPSPEEVRNAIKTDESINDLSHDTAIHRHSIDAVVLSADHESHPYCHFQYRAAFSENDTAQSPGTTTREQPWYVRSRAFYFENGQFAVQPTRGLPETWLPSFIARITETDIADGFKFYESKNGGSDPQRTSEHSSTSGSVSRVPTSDRSFVSPPAPSNPSHSGGDPADLLEEATRTGTVGPQHTLRGDSSDTGFTPGTVVATWNETDWPNDAGEAKRATEIHRQIVPYLRNHV